MSSIRAVVVAVCIPAFVACGTTGSSIGPRGSGAPASSSGSSGAFADASSDATGEDGGTSGGAADGGAPGVDTDAAGRVDSGVANGGAGDGGSVDAGTPPSDGAATGSSCDGGVATSCFSTRDWAVANLEPCFATTTDGMGNPVTTAYASTPGDPVQCGLDPNSGAPVVPGTWSTDTLQVDCVGVFALCFTLKAGDGTHPQAGDCVVAQTCSAAHYGPVGSTMVFPPLPGWISSPDESACAAAFAATGGYGEMSVSGQTDACQTVQRVFQTVIYCPTTCGGPDAPAQCASCVPGGGGPF